jgi:uncharacterized membrane protein
MRRLKSLIFYTIFVLISILWSTHFVHAQDTPDTNTIVKAKVVQVIGTSTEATPDSNTPSPVQTLRAQILEGSQKGQVVEFSNDYTQLSAGDLFYLSATITSTGVESYGVSDPDRLPILSFFLIVFLILVILFGGIQGLRGLLSLAGSLLLITYVLLPAIIHGISPLLVSIVVSSLIIILGSYITHGFNKTTSSAVVGMIITVIITGLMAFYGVHASHLTGITGDETAYLSSTTAGGINLIGLLMGGIMIGLLGILYDVSIGQAISVEELYHVAPHLGRWKIYKRAIRMGREHIGALVNMLAIAYVGASLPLLLIFYPQQGTSLLLTINNEIFTTEILRTLIGSIGLVLAVPITTLLSVYMIIKIPKRKPSEEILKEEEKLLAHVEHHH